MCLLAEGRLLTRLYGIVPELIIMIVIMTIASALHDLGHTVKSNGVLLKEDYEPVEHC